MYVTVLVFGIKEVQQNLKGYHQIPQKSLHNILLYNKLKMQNMIGSPCSKFSEGSGNK